MGLSNLCCCSWTFRIIATRWLTLWVVEKYAWQGYYTSTLVEAVLNGQLDVLIWMVNYYKLWDSSRLEDKPGILGQHFVLPHGGFTLWYEWSYIAAATKGHTHVLEFNKDKYQISEHISIWACLNAVSEGHLDTLQWFHDNDYHLSVEMCHAVASTGRIDIL